MAFKFDIFVISSFLILAMMAEAVFCGGGGESHHETVKVPYKIHTIHHHHVEKYPVYKKIEVPVLKEIKVPYPVHYAVKVPYPVVLKPHIVTVPIHHEPQHTEEHQHHVSQSSHGEDGGKKDW